MTRPNQDFINYLETKFELVNQKLETMHVETTGKFNAVEQKLLSIEEQTKKTNGRVTKLEDNNLEMNFFKKYPITIAIGIIAVVVVFVVTFINKI